MTEPYATLSVLCSSVIRVETTMVERKREKECHQNILHCANQLTPLPPLLQYTEY